MKKLLTIAGSDCSGGAGIQADLKTFTVLGSYGMSVITAITAQNTTGVRAVDLVSAAMVRDQLKAVLEDIPPDAIKIGMLGDVAQVAVIVDALTPWANAIPIVVDPVMVATSGAVLTASETVQAMITGLFPLATLITPNLAEGEVLSGQVISTHRDMETAARRMQALGAKAVLVKGGHLEGGADDCLFDGQDMHWFQRPLLKNPNTHGTGCTLSSAIAVYLAQGHTLPEAVAAAKTFVFHAIQHNEPLGTGRGPLNHLWQSIE